MAWVRIDDEFPDNENGAPLGLLGRGLFLDILCYCNHNLTDGRVPDRVMLRFLADPDLAGQGDAVLERLERGEFLKRAERRGLTTWQVVHYHRYQPSKKDVLEQRAKVSAERAEAGKRGATKRWQPDSKGDSKPDGKGDGKPIANRMAKGVADGCQDGWQTNSPVPVPGTPKDQDHRPPGGRDPSPVENDPPNPRVIARLVHELTEANAYETEADLKEDLKALCARHHVAYDAESVRLALDNVRTAARKRRTA